MNSEQVVFREYPILLWLFGIMGIVVAAFVAQTVWELLLLEPLGVAMVGFASILTVSVENKRGTLSLRYRSLFRMSTKVYPLNEISFVNVAQDREGERMYRLELILQSGEVVPLRWGYIVGKKHQERRAQRLRSALQPGNEPRIQWGLLKE
jgi:hypothetical protein